LAFEDMPLASEEGQVISQPFSVALMIGALELSGTEKVLEVGTGSGYQAAVLAGMCRRVVTVERYVGLVESAQDLLKDLGHDNIEVHLAGKNLGWPQESPYEAIIVGAGVPCIPQELLDQLALRGRLVVPVGSYYEQDIVKLVKLGTGMKVTRLGLGRFTPLVGEGGWPQYY
jgi:protein-L-isoaspartate(D-aspartate) O-methyltransferase